MTFTPKYLPYVEAARIVGERTGTKKEQISPLLLACREGKILPEIECDGKWRRQGAWAELNICWPNPVAQVRPRDDEITLSQIQFLTSDIDLLWPPTGYTAGAALPSGDLSPFIKMVIEASEHFKITDKSAPKIDELVQYFRAKRLPDGSPISARMARTMATLCRWPSAMKGGNKRLG